MLVFLFSYSWRAVVLWTLLTCPAWRCGSTSKSVQQCGLVGGRGGCALFVFNRIVGVEYCPFLLNVTILFLLLIMYSAVNL